MFDSTNVSDRSTIWPNSLFIVRHGESAGNVARDEHRHVAFGSVFLREKAREDERYKVAIQRTLEESLPVADGVLSPPWAEGGDDFELFGYSLDETRQFAGTCLMRRLKVIGLG